MRRLSIFLFFWIVITLAISRADVWALILLLTVFLPLYAVAEELD